MIQPIEEMTARQMSGLIWRRFGIRAGQFTMIQANENEVNRQAWYVDICDVGSFQVTQHSAGSYDSKSYAEMRAKEVAYEEILKTNGECINTHDRY